MPVPSVSSSERVRAQLLTAGAGFAVPFRGVSRPDARPASVLVLFSPRAGADAHSAAARPVVGRPDVAHSTAARAASPHPAAPRDGAGLDASDLDVLLQVRSTDLAEHAGQVSFPGGRRDARDADAVATALREASEETGLEPGCVEVLATLPPLPLAASNHLVTPVLAWWETPRELHAIDSAETTRVWQASVGRLLEAGTRFTSVLHRGSLTFRSPAFDADGTIVWGFTAMVLDGLFDAAGWTQPWDRTRERTVAT